MNRRALLTCTGVTFTAAVAGCLVDGGRTDDTITVSAPTVRPGETATIAVVAPNLSRLHLSDVPEEVLPGGRLHLNGATFTPPPEIVWESYPPHWHFDNQDVDGRVPIETFPETLTDTYEFGFDFQIAGEPEPRTVVTTVTVENSSNS